MIRTVSGIEPSWAGADPFHPTFKDDPYAVLNPLREQHRVNLTPVGTYRVTRYDDLKSIFKHKKKTVLIINYNRKNQNKFINPKKMENLEHYFQKFRKNLKLSTITNKKLQSNLIFKIFFKSMTAKKHQIV